MRVNVKAKRRAAKKAANQELRKKRELREQELREWRQAALYFDHRPKRIWAAA